MLVALVRSIVVATAVATTATNVLLIAAMVATLSLAAIARGMRQSKGRQSRGVVGVERLQGRHGCVGSSVSSCKTRLSQTLWKDENGVLSVMMAQR
jgi:membrane protein implicated in regulation of membrane protease activity